MKYKKKIGHKQDMWFVITTGKISEAYAYNIISVFYDEDKCDREVEAKNAEVEAKNAEYYVLPLDKDLRD